MTRWIFLSRHGERDDRYSEAQGIDWLSTASRPQDPPLSSSGKEQIRAQGVLLQAEVKKLETQISCIFSSPTIRCVQTSDIYAQYSGSPISIEPGLVEEAKSFRGRVAGEPQPSWNPLVLSAEELQKWSSRINLDYVVGTKVEHVPTETRHNGCQEIHQEDPSITEDSLVMKSRIVKVKAHLKEVLNGLPENGAVLVVSHGAVVKNLSRELNGGTDYGKAYTGSFTCFRYEDGDFSAMYDSWQHSEYRGHECPADNGGSTPK